MKNKCCVSNSSYSFKYQILTTVTLLALSIQSTGFAQSLVLQEIKVDNANDVSVNGTPVSENNSATWPSANPFNFNALSTENFGNAGFAGGNAYGIGNSNFEFTNSASIGNNLFNGSGVRWNPADGPAPNGFYYNGFNGSSDSFTTTTVRYTNTGQTGNVDATFNLAPTILGTTNVAGLGVNQTLAFSYFEIAAGPDENNLDVIAYGAHTMDGLQGTTNSTLVGADAPNFFLSSSHKLAAREWIGDLGSGFQGFGQDVYQQHFEIFVPVALDISLGTVAGDEDLVIRYTEQASARVNDMGNVGCDFDLNRLTCVDSPPDLPPIYTTLTETPKLIYGDLDQVFNSLNQITTMNTAFAQTGDPFSLTENEPGTRPISSFVTFNSVPEPSSLLVLGLISAFGFTQRRRKTTTRHTLFDID